MKYPPLQKTVAPKSLMIPAGDQNCYDYYDECSKGYGEYYAVQHMDKRLTRTESFREIDGLSAYFTHELGLKRGDVYTVFMPTTIESIFSFYALTKIGVIVNFVHPQLPADALKEALETCNAKGVMVLDVALLKGASKPEEYIKVINESGLPCIVCSPSTYASKPKEIGTAIGSKLLKAKFPKIEKRTEYKKAVAMYPPEEGIHGNGNDIAVYLHGGGTTGKAKIIMLTHKAINELACRVSKLDKIQYPGDEAEVIVLPLFHCFGLCIGIHMAMCNAGRIIPIMQFDRALFTKLMRKNNVIAVVGIPVMFKKLVKYEKWDGPWLKNIRMMFCGGDECSDQFLDDFNAILEKNGAPGKLRQGYGLTEVGSVCTVNSNWDYRRGSIGWALDGVRVEIRDDDMNPVPDGEVGEICVAGPTIMAGYYTPGCQLGDGLYTDEDGEKWVRTGDLGYRDPTPDEKGKYYFFFTGRKKRVIIISGYNVYPADIEKHIQDDFPEVKDSCLVKGFTSEGRMILRLFVDFKHSKPSNEEEYKKKLTEYIEARFDRFSVPREIVFLDKLPETPLMKIDFMKLTQNKSSDPVYSE